MSQTDAYDRARARAKSKYGFYVHLAVYLAVMAFLVILNIVTSPGANWSIWPLLGWGLAVMLPGVRVFFSSGESRIVDALTERELRQSEQDKGD